VDPGSIINTTTQLEDELFLRGGGCYACVLCHYLFWPGCVEYFSEAICGCQSGGAGTLRRVPDSVATWETEGRESGSESVTSQQRVRDRSGRWPLVRTVLSDHLCCTIYPVLGLSCEDCLVILRVREYTDLRDLRTVLHWFRLPFLVTRRDPFLSISFLVRCTP
jgi:hypothetical protein